MNTIENYLNNILAKQLKEFDVDDAVCSTVVSDIRKNMLSLLQYWHDEKFKKTILLIGLEEGRFYEPNANTEVKCFVVVTIRNSKLETLASDNYCALNAKRIIEDYEIKAITSYAIKYFSDVDFNELSLSLDYKNINNIYIALKEKYQMAWNAFESIGNTKRKRVRYNRITSDPDSELICLIKNTYNAQYKLMSKTVLDGYDESLDDDIINILYFV